MATANDKKRILFLRTDWGVSEYRKKHNAYGGIGYYRIVKPAQALAEAYPDEYEVESWGKEALDRFGDTPEMLFAAIFRTFDLLITKEMDGRDGSNMLAIADYFKKPVIIDSDDNFRAIRADNPAAAVYGKGTDERYFRTAFLSLASGLTTSTEPLKDAFSDINGRIDVLPNCNDFRDWQNLPKPARAKDDFIRIGYAGGVSHNIDLEMVRPLILQVMKKYPNVRFEILGAYDKKEALKMIEEFAAVADRIQFFAGTPSWTGYPQALAEMGWDIGIAPLAQDPFNLCKSHIKWMEYSMLKIPTVASRTYPYAEMIQGTPVIEQGKTGFLVKHSTPEHWITYLSQLIENEALRTEMGQAAYDAVARNWQWKDHIYKWKRVIDSYLNAI